MRSVTAGVYVELEAMALSRDIPVVLRWLVDPFVRKASVSTMFSSLKQTREAVIADGRPNARPFSGAISLRAQ